MSTGAGKTGVARHKAVARVALIHVDQATQGVLRDSFKQFGIQTVAVSGDPVERLQKEKFEACVLPLEHEDAQEVLIGARTSRSNSRIVIYGICASAQQAMRFSRYGINAVFDAPVERPAALKVVRATRLLVIHELRRYVRLPIVTEVEIESERATVRATSQEISAGGMSMETETRFTMGRAVEVSFTLPGAKRMAIKATICWMRPSDRLVGARFDTADEARLKVREWIDEYLEI